MHAAVTPITKLYSDFENEQLEIKFGAAYGHYPSQPYIRKIKEIVDNTDE